MALFGGADEVVVRDSHPLPELAEFRRNLIGVLLRRFAGGLRRALDLLTVLVGAGQEERVSAQQSLAPRNRVAGDRGVSVANVRPRVDVVNRGRDVELSRHADVDLRHRFLRKNVGSPALILNFGRVGLALDNLLDLESALCESILPTVLTRKKWNSSAAPESQRSSICAVSSPIWKLSKSRPPGARTRIISRSDLNQIRQGTGLRSRKMPRCRPMYCL